MLTALPCANSLIHFFANCKLDTSGRNPKLFYTGLEMCPNHLPNTIYALTRHTQNHSQFLCNRDARNHQISRVASSCAARYRCIPKGGHVDRVYYSPKFGLCNVKPYSHPAEPEPRCMDPQGSRQKIVVSAPNETLLLCLVDGV